jgi:hypothetical protein
MDCHPVGQIMDVGQKKESDPGPCMACFKRVLQLIRYGALIICYVSFETTGALLTSRALKPDPHARFKPLPSNLTVVNAAFSLILGMLITAFIAYRSERSFCAALKAVKAALDLRTILSYSFVAACFTTQGVFSYLAYSRLDAGLKKILDQLRMPAIAALSRVFVGRRYSMHEWLALIIVFSAICSFYSADVAHDEVTELHTKCRYPASCFEEAPYDVCALRVDGAKIAGVAVMDRKNQNVIAHRISEFAVTAADTDRIGLAFSLVAVCCSCVGCLLSEKLMKQSASVPYATQRLQMEMTGFPVSVAMAFIVPLWIDPRGGQASWWAKNEAEGSGEGFFQGFTSLTFLVAAINLTQIWLGGMIIKHFSALVNKISGCVTLTLTVLIGGTILKPCEADPLPVSMLALTVVIGSSIVLFATTPKEESTPATEVAPTREVFLPKSQRDMESSIQLEDNPRS